MRRWVCTPITSLFPERTNLAREAQDIEVSVGPDTRLSHTGVENYEFHPMTHFQGRLNNLKPEDVSEWSIA